MPLKLNSSGGGSVTLDTPSTASTYTLTVPAITGTAVVTGSSATVSQGMLASNVASNGPAFSAYSNTTQTLSGATYTKVTFGNEYFDTNNNFASSRFTPTVAGYYQLNTTLYNNSSNTFIGRLYKNGADFVELFRLASGQGASGSTIVYANGSTDYFEIYGFIAGAGGTLGNGTDTIFVQYSGCMVRAA